MINIISIIIIIINSSSSGRSNSSSSSSSSISSSSSSIISSSSSVIIIINVLLLLMLLSTDWLEAVSQAQTLAERISHEIYDFRQNNFSENLWRKLRQLLVNTCTVQHHT